jgi:hypothetical protein
MRNHHSTCASSELSSGRRQHDEPAAVSESSVLDFDIAALLPLQRAKGMNKGIWMRDATSRYLVTWSAFPLSSFWGLIAFLTCASCSPSRMEQEQQQQIAELRARIEELSRHQSGVTTTPSSAIAAHHHADAGLDIADATVVGVADTLPQNRPPPQDASFSEEPFAYKGQQVPPPPSSWWCFSGYCYATIGDCDIPRQKLEIEIDVSRLGSRKDGEPAALLWCYAENAPKLIPLSIIREKLARVECQIYSDTTGVVERDSPPPCTASPAAACFEVKRVLDKTVKHTCFDSITRCERYREELMQTSSSDWIVVIDCKPTPPR